MRILVVEDEPKVANALRAGLEAQGYATVVAQTGEDGFFRINTERFDLIILDRMLPGRDGLDVLGAMRKRSDVTPVLLLTARDAVEDRVEGLDTGADDYVVKPFAFPELLARIRVLLRRGRAEPDQKLALGELEMDLLTREAKRAGQPLQLTNREFDLLEYLLRHHGQVVSREMLAQDVWRVTARATPIDNVIDVQIARLRRKIDDPFRQPLIHTVRGLGFMLRETAP